MTAITIFLVIWFLIGYGNAMVILTDKDKYGRFRFQITTQWSQFRCIILNTLFGPISIYITRNRNYGK